MKASDTTYRVALFGHRCFGEYAILDDRLSKLIEKLINEKEFLEIYIGRNGEFDIYAASVIKRVQRLKGRDNCELVCVLPYDNKNVEYYAEYYDSVRIFEMLKFHPKRAITERNEKMIEMCDLLICYVEHKGGGAYRAMEYAHKLHKEIINLFEK